MEPREFAKLRDIVKCDDLDERMCAIFESCSVCRTYAALNPTNSFFVTNSMEDNFDSLSRKP